MAPWALICCLTIIGPAAGSKDAPLQIGDPAPMFKAKDLTGRAFALGDWVGEEAKDKRAAVILVFADPLVEDSSRELNSLSKLDAEWFEHSLEIVHIDVGGDEAAFAEFVDEEAIPWTSLPDKQGNIAAKYGAERAPYLVIVSGEGKIEFVSDEYSVPRHNALRIELGRIHGKALPWGDKGRRSAILGQGTKLEFGRPPSDPGAPVRWQPLAMVLGKASNAYISMSTAQTYKEYEKRIGAGEYQIADAGPVIGVRMLDKYEPLVTFERREKATYRGILFGRRDRGVLAVGDLRGKTLALVSANSSSGGIFPVAELLQAGLKPEVDVRLLWTGSHTDVAKAVLKGEADAGACYDDCRQYVWPSETQREKETKIIGLTDDIPTEMIFVRRDMSERLKDRLRHALLSAAAREIILNQISGKETPISGVSQADEAVLRKVKKVIKGVPEVLREAKEIARARNKAERQGR